MKENVTLQTKLHSHNSSFVSASAGGVSESMELMKANYERDEHKWNAEKLSLRAQIRELEQIVKNKDEEASLAQKRLEKNF